MGFQKELIHINTNYLALYCINSMLIPIAMCQHSHAEGSMLHTAPFS